MTTTPTPNTHRSSTDSREALTDSERKASHEHPENFKEVATDDKVVEILPIDGEGAAIRGIDPEK